MNKRKKNVESSSSSSEGEDEEEEKRREEEKRKKKEEKKKRKEEERKRKEEEEREEEEKFDGWFADGKRFGDGVLYNRNGIIEYNGLWKNDEVYSPHSSGSTVDNHTETVTIGDGSFNNREPFIPSFYIHSLKRVVIGDDCFGKVRVLELDGLGELKSVVIGKECFTYAKTYDDIWIGERSDGSCRIVNCPKLKSIQIGDRSFQDYNLFELNNLPSLRSIDISVRCFYYAPSFSLTGLIDGLV